LFVDEVFNSPEGLGRLHVDPPERRGRSVLLAVAPVIGTGGDAQMRAACVTSQLGCALVGEERVGEEPACVDVAESEQALGRCRFEVHLVPL
jgi:hypothetical protein